MNIDPDRLADLRARKLAALVRGRWGEITGAPRSTAFPGGSTLIDEVGGRVWVLTDDDPARRLGGALAVAVRAHADEVHVLVSDPLAGGILARRASQFRDAPHVWLVDDLDLLEIQPAAPAVELPVAPGAELYRPVLAAAGLRPIAEGGILLGEYRGLEVARVVIDADGTARVETGVGRFDRDAGALMFADQGETDALARVVELAGQYRRADAERHPINQLVAERWLRDIVLTQPHLVGARSLEAVPAAVLRRNLLESGVASATGESVDGTRLLVTCSTGVDLDLVPSAADDRLSAAPGARLVLVLPARDAVPLTHDIAARLAAPAEVVVVPDNWRELTLEGS